MKSEEKRCSKCRITKPAFEFHNSKHSKSGLASRCKECCSTLQKKMRRDSKPERIAYQKTRRSSNIAKCQDYVITYLSNHACVDCGESDIICLDFDHRDPLTKDRSVSELARRGTCISRLIVEIDKCDVRCANCHRRRTASQFAYWKLSHESN